MRLLTANKILLASCAVIVPASIYGGISLKEWYLAREFAKVPEDSQLVHERAMRARIVQLEQERKELLAEQRDLATKMAEVRARVAEQQQQKA